MADTLLAGRLPEDARPVYTGRNKLYVCRLADGLEVNIKQFRRCSLLKGLIYGRLRRNKALRSLLNARRLRSLGFDSPEPLMACWTRSAGGWCLRSAYYVCAQLDDVRETRCWEEWPDRGPFTALWDARWRACFAPACSSAISPPEMCCCATTRPPVTIGLSTSM